MSQVLSRYWWVLTVRGVFGVAFGLVALTLPRVTFLGLTLFFGAYLFADGVMALTLGAQNFGAGRRWWMCIAEGALGIGVGILTWFWPWATAFAILMWIAAWMLITGVLEITEAVRLRRAMDHEWMLMFAGICSVAFGGIVLVYPMTAMIALVFLLAAYSLIFGTFLVVLGFEARQLARAHH